MIYIKREKGFEGNLPSFTTKDAAMKYIVNNTGSFEPNEIIAIVDFISLECAFVKMELTIIAKVL